jgi:hypothetical protein
MDRALDYYMPHIDQDVVRDIESWPDHPELGKLYRRLDGLGDPNEFVNIYSKAMMARHLWQHGLDVQVDVPVPDNKPANLRATRGDVSFVVHVKRLNPDRATREQLAVVGRTEPLQQIMRPIIALLDFNHLLSDEQMHRFVGECEPFLAGAQLGQQMTVTDSDGTPLGTCQAWREWKGPHVTVMAAPSLRWGRDWRRFRTMLVTAYARFMPAAFNVVMVTGAWPDDAGPVERALLGTPYVKREGRGRHARTVDQGRKPDAFWSEGQHPESKAVGWFFFDLKRSWLRSCLWFRPGADIDPAVRAELTRIFDVA